MEGGDRNCRGKEEGESTGQQLTSKASTIQEVTPIAQDPTAATCQDVNLDLSDANQPPNHLYTVSPREAKGGRREGEGAAAEGLAEAPGERGGPARVERGQCALCAAQVAKPGWLLWGGGGARAGSACPSWCPTVAMPTPRLCFRMLYLISHVWNSNYVISQHRVAMTASPTFLVPRVAHTLG